MTCTALAAGGRKVQPQKPHLLCQPPAVPRPGGNWLLVTAITSHRPSFAQGTFTICSIIVFGSATSPCHRWCSSTGRQGWLSGWQGTEEKGNSWSLQKAVGNEVGSGVGTRGQGVLAGAASCPFLQRQPLLQQTRAESWPRSKAPTRTNWTAVGKTTFHRGCIAMKIA